MAKLTIITPFLNEAENIPRLYARLCDVATILAPDVVELVMVDDGSTDNSVEVIRSLPHSGLPVRVVCLSRNFGSHAALAAGVSHAQGDAMVFISADMQDPPEMIQQMMQKWHEGFEVVWGTRESRQDPLSVTLFSATYYKLVRKFALPQMPVGGVDMCLVDKRVTASLGNLQEKNSNIFNLLLWAGFRQIFIPYHREERKAGKSKWSMAKKVKLFIDSFVAFSFAPIRLISVLGGIISLSGLALALFIALRAVLVGGTIPGWASLMVVTLFLSGIQMLMLGVISEYLWRALDASRDRPLYIVRQVVDTASELSLTSRKSGVEPVTPMRARREVS